MPLKTLAEIEQKIRSRAYPSYAAACVGISKLKLATTTEKQSLKDLAAVILGRAAPKTVRVRMPRPVKPAKPAKPALVQPVVELDSGLLTGHEEEDWFKPLSPEKAAEVGLEPDESEESAA